MFCSEGQWKGKRPQCHLESKELEENDMDMDFQDDQCPMGYEMVAEKCQDVDECAEANGGCDQLCTNKPGSALCGCTRGYTLAEDGQRHVV